MLNCKSALLFNSPCMKILIMPSFHLQDKRQRHYSPKFYRQHLVFTGISPMFYLHSPITVLASPNKPNGRVPFVCNFGSLNNNNNKCHENSTCNSIDPFGYESCGTCRIYHSFYRSFNKIMPGAPRDGYFIFIKSITQRTCYLKKGNR